MLITFQTITTALLTQNKVSESELKFLLLLLFLLFKLRVCLITRLHQDISGYGTIGA